MKDAFFDLLEAALQESIVGYAVVYKDKDGSIKSRNSFSTETCSFYEVLGMVTQLQHDLLMDARTPSIQEDEDESTSTR